MVKRWNGGDALTPLKSIAQLAASLAQRITQHKKQLKNPTSQK